MGILEIFQTKKRDNRNNHTFSDEEREQATIKRLQNKIMTDRLKFLQEKQRKKQLEEQISALEDDLEDEDDDDDFDMEESPETKLLRLLEKVMQPKPEVPAATLSKSPQEIVQLIPQEQREKLRKMKPDQIKELATLYYPDIPPQKVEAIIPLL